MRVLAVRRARLFSPGHEEHDWLVLKESAERVARDGHTLRFTTEEEIGEEPPRADVVLNMCQGPLANERLRAAEGDGVLLVNRPSAALECLRYRLLPRLRDAGIPIPESVEIDTTDGAPDGLRDGGRLWIKRADVHATHTGDVACVEGGSQARTVLAAFRERGLERAIVQQHLEGAVVKFYGVGDRVLHQLVTSGDPRTSFDLDLLRLRARQCREALGLDVYGGECVVTADGTLPVIDVNDWPSFAPCRPAAAAAIASHVLERIGVPA
jgi:hypothetical protein